MLLRAAAKRTTRVMLDGHGLAGGAGGSRLDSGTGVGRALIGCWPVRCWRGGMWFLIVWSFM